MNFCPNCGCRLSEDEEYSESYNDYCPDNVGIIFTDTGVLARKYGVSTDDVDEVLSNFIEKTEQFDQEWHFLDMHYHQD